jgi:glycosyltransferase involved in cell wall biosynthesis
MKNIFEENKVLEKVDFKGFVNKEELLEELYTSDILLYPAYHHGLATIILQSMYCYLPIISMSGDIISDVVHKKCGLAADGNTFEEIENNLYQNTKELIENNELRNKLSLNARELLKDKFTWEKLTINMNNIYKKVQND